MENRSALQRFVECGGWIKRERLAKPKSAVAWVLAVAWFVGFTMAFSSDLEVTMGFWKVVMFGQVGLIGVACCVGAIEKPVLRTRLVPNPDKKPEAFY